MSHEYLNIFSKISFRAEEYGPSYFFEVAMSGTAHVSVISSSSSIRNFFKFGFNSEKAEFYRRQFSDILSVCDKLWLKWRKLSCIVLLWAFFISLNINCCWWTFQRRNQFLSFPHVQVMRELPVLNICSMYWIFLPSIKYFVQALNISSKWWESCQYWIFLVLPQ